MSAFMPIFVTWIRFLLADPNTYMYSRGLHNADPDHHPPLVITTSLRTRKKWPQAIK